jgi:hypothetical protein
MPSGFKPKPGPLGPDSLLSSQASRQTDEAPRYRMLPPAGLRAGPAPCETSRQTVDSKSSLISDPGLLRFSDEAYGEILLCFPNTGGP